MCPYDAPMSTGEILERLRALPPAERREIVAKIWDEFADRDFELTPAQAAELDRRMVDHEVRPEKVVSWDEIKSSTLTKYGPRP